MVNAMPFESMGCQARAPVPARMLERSGSRALDELLSAHKEAIVERPDQSLRCRACGKAVAREQDRISVLGTHEHSCTNPHGIHFHIGCFREAPGGAEIGVASGEHTWFAGYRWRIMLCGQCGTHLGWGFHAQGGDRFCGLILDRLSYPQ